MTCIYRGGMDQNVEVALYRLAPPQRLINVRFYIKHLFSCLRECSVSLLTHIFWQIQY